MKKIDKLVKRFTYTLVQLEVPEIFGILRILDIKVGDDEDFLDVVVRAQEAFRKLNRVQRANLLKIMEAAAEPEQGEGD